MSQKTLDLVVPNVIMMDLGDKELLIAGGSMEDSRSLNGQGARGSYFSANFCNSLSSCLTGLCDCASSCCLFLN